MAARKSNIYFAVSAPASLLLMGEYAVLEEGGLGVAVAPGVRVIAETEPGEPCIIGRYPGGSDSWPGSGFMGRIGNFLERTCGPPRLGGQVTIDSSPFFLEDGRKRGFGSSGALAVVVTALWSQHAGDIDELFQIAVAAHRYAQGKLGSGYDVACSTYGGILRFRGGERPSALHITLPWLPPLILFSGPQSVDTVSAVAVYRRWKADSPEQASGFLRASNSLVEAFVGAKDWPAACKVLADYIELSVRLGDDIGVPARLDPPVPMKSGMWKTVGAGNELGVMFGDTPPSWSANPEPVVIAQDGLRWQ